MSRRLHRQRCTRDVVRAHLPPDGRDQAVSEHEWRGERNRRSCLVDAGENINRSAGMCALRFSIYVGVLVP